MDPFFAWIESSQLSVWLRESLSVFAFPMVLTLHTVGLAFLVGPATAAALRLLGVAERIPLVALRDLLKVMWAGFWLNAVTGAALVVAYPTKALTNPLFYIKLALIGGAILGSMKMRGAVMGNPESMRPESLRTWAVSSICLWVLAIFAGRWLAYTYGRLLVGH